ncbi:hypothetical protein EI555_010714, partial [Monodon monoceros]
MTLGDDALSVPVTKDADALRSHGIRAQAELYKTVMGVLRDNRGLGGKGLRAITGVLCEDEKGVRDAPAMRYKTTDVARLEACLPAFRPVFMKFAMWVDAVIFVFSLEDEISFQTVYHYYSRMANYRNTSEIPLVLVGTQDAISSTNPRVIDDARARKLSSDLKRCTYYETCATYGLNVERVFQD